MIKNPQVSTKNGIEYVTTGYIAEELGYSPSWILRIIKSKEKLFKLFSYKKGRTWYIQKDMIKTLFLYSK